MGELLPEFWSPTEGGRLRPGDERATKPESHRHFHLAPMFWSVCLSTGPIDTLPDPGPDGIHVHDRAS